ncbi:hypothetical protein GCM10009623_39780 [Nocardioides aestuarii]|uniref:Uncharacterized protein n=1 Tax=Nocardioides aestuarii TaxID=252231 RepID=A0ABW4TUB3_9ACTN
MAHTTHAPAPQAPKPATSPGHHSPATIASWALIAVGIVAAGVLALTVTAADPPAPRPVDTPNGSLVDIPRDPEIAERWLAHHAEVLGGRPGPSVAGWPDGVHHSADAAERWFIRIHDAGVSVDGWPKGVAHNPDALDRWLAQQR